MAYVTLEFAGQEKPISDYGFELSSAEQTTENQARDIFSATVPTETLLDDPIFPFEAQIIIRIERESGSGAPNSFSGGTQDFVGKRLRERIALTGQDCGVTYRFAGPYYDLEHTVYQQKTAGYNNATHAIEYGHKPESILYTGLNEANALVARTNGAQCRDILQFLLDAYAETGLPAPYQIGTIDPALNLPSQICKPQMCSAALEQCLQLSPDCNLYFDYSSAPPTAHIRKRANLTAVTLPLFDDETNEGLNIEPLPELVATAVLVYYKRQNTVDGSTRIAWELDKYPLDGPTKGLRVIVECIDLAGFATTSVNGSLDCEPLPLAGASNAVKRAWWGSARGGDGKMFSDLQLRLQKYDGTASNIPNATITDEEGNPVNLALYPNKLVDGSIHPWMTLSDHTPVIAKRCKVKIVLPCTLYDVVGASEADLTGKVITAWGTKEFVANITLTNGVTGDYSAPASFEAGEATPVGVAQAIYDSLAEMQYEGNYVRVQSTISGAPTPGNVLNLSNGRAEWATMKAQIQSVRKSYGLGYSEVSIGPARHLNAGELASIFNALRYRRVWFNPATRASGEPGGGSVGITKHMPKTNTTQGTNDPVDTTNSTGSLAADARIKLFSSALKTLTAGKSPYDPAHVPHEMKLKEVAICNPETGENLKCVAPLGGSYA